LRRVAALCAFDSIKWRSDEQVAPGLSCCLVFDSGFCSCVDRFGCCRCSFGEMSGGHCFGLRILGCCRFAYLFGGLGSDDSIVFFDSGSTNFEH